MQNSTTNLTECTVSGSYLNATGNIRYTMTNDYMFNVIFRHTDILAELLCSLLDLKQEEITSPEVNNPGDWADRSLSYLCRSFDQLYRGEQYASTKSVLHIGILDFNLFPKNPKFYASYKLMDMENLYIYNDKFELRVLELKHINLATEADRERGLVRWALLSIRLLAERAGVGFSRRLHGRRSKCWQMATLLSAR